MYWTNIRAAHCNCRASSDASDKTARLQRFRSRLHLNMPQETQSSRRWRSLTSLQEFENDSYSSCCDEEYESDQMDDEESTTSDESRVRRGKRGSELPLPLMDQHAFLEVGGSGAGRSKAKSAISTLDLSRAHRDRHGHPHRVRSSSDVRITPIATSGPRGAPRQGAMLKRKISRVELVAPIISRATGGSQTLIFVMPKDAQSIVRAIEEAHRAMERAVREKQSHLESYRDLYDRFKFGSSKAEQPKPAEETEPSPIESPDIEPVGNPDGSPIEIRRRYRCCVQTNEDLIGSIMEFLAARRSSDAPRLSLSPVGSGQFELPTDQVLEIMLLLNSQLAKLLVCTVFKVYKL